MKYPDYSKELWQSTYKGPDDNSIEDTINRQALACAAVEKEEIREQVYKDFVWLLSDHKGIAGGRITANLGVAGREATTLMNCFTHNPRDIGLKDPDSIRGIYTLLEAQAQTLKSEGGYGTNFSYIRPAGCYVKGIDGRTPGVLKFMEMWDKSSEIITMGSEALLGERRKSEKAKIRKGAQMAILGVTHPEIYDFIDAKLTPGRLTKFNLSVGITNGFMEAVLADADWDLKFPDTECKEYSDKWNGDIEDWEELGLPVIVHKTVKARELWNKIMHATYTRNDPGVVFLDLANKFNPLSYAEKILQTNPCGEIQMPTGVCLLFSLNLVKFIKNNQFDFETFAKAVAIATRFSDNINDISRVPLPEYKQSMLDKRRVGLGVLGLGSLHYMLGIRFGSNDSTSLIENIFKVKCETEILTSAKLGQEKGSFPLFDRDKHFNTLWWKTLPISNDVKRQVEEIGCMRNSHHAANAPTGNMSIYAGLVSGGIEPVFMKEYARWSIVPEFDRYELRKAGFNFPDISKGEWFETEHVKLAKAGTDDILLGKFNDVEYQVDKNRGLTKKTIIEDYGYSWCKENLSKEEFARYESNGVFCTTNDLSVDDHINSLKALAKFVNMNSSKTVNIPNDYKYEDFKDLYLNAWKNGIKGITSYRAGTMMAVLEEVKSSDAKNSEQSKTKESNIRESHILRDAPKRPKVLNSQTHKVRLDNGDGVQNAYITVSFFPETSDPYEVFINTIGNNLKDLQIIELSARMTSLALRHGVPVKYIAEQLHKIDGQYIYSIPNNLSKVLSNYTDNDEEVEQEIDIDLVGPEPVKAEFKNKVNMGVCPECGAHTLIKEEGCEKCLSCTYSKCS